jgi:hypothetical protein
VISCRPAERESWKYGAAAHVLQRSRLSNERRATSVPSTARCRVAVRPVAFAYWTTSVTVSSSGRFTSQVMASPGASNPSTNPDPE